MEKDVSYFIKEIENIMLFWYILFDNIIKFKLLRAGHFKMSELKTSNIFTCVFMLSITYFSLILD